MVQTNGVHSKKLNNKYFYSEISTLYFVMLSDIHFNILKVCILKHVTFHIPKRKLTWKSFIYMILILNFTYRSYKFVFLNKMTKTTLTSYSWRKKKIFIVLILQQKNLFLYGHCETSWALIYVVYSYSLLKITISYTRSEDE